MAEELAQRAEPAMVPRSPSPVLLAADSSFLRFPPHSCLVRELVEALLIVQRHSTRGASKEAA